MMPAHAHRPWNCPEGEFCASGPKEMRYTAVMQTSMKSELENEAFKAPNSQVVRQNHAWMDRERRHTGVLVPGQEFQP